MKRLGRICSAGPLCVFVVACSGANDPASQAPVDPEAGLYEISLSGAGPMKADPGKSKTYCLREGERASFAHMLAQNYYKLHYSCTVNRTPREGNAVGGEIKCPADPKLAEGANSFVYGGVVAKENARVEVKMKFNAQVKEGAMSQGEAVQLKLAMKALEQMRFVIEAKRIGDCS